jgi:hypothetical protein
MGPVQGRERHLIGLAMPSAIPILSLFLTGAAGLWAQRSESEQGSPSGTGSNIANTCIEPAPAIRWEDYEGPLQTVGELARKLDRKSDRKTRYPACPGEGRVNIPN